MTRNVYTIVLVVLSFVACKDDTASRENARSFAVLSETKLIAADGDIDDLFGHSISMAGNILVVGAHQDNNPEPAGEHVSDDGSDSGAAYVFVYDGNAWAQEAKLTPDIRVTKGLFGRAVAATGGTALVGSPRARSNNMITGAVYVFARNGTAWIQEAKLAPSDGNYFDAFGWSVAIDGNTAIIGAYTADGADGSEDTGAAYVFVRDGATWRQEAKLTAGDAAAGDVFGASVAIDGDTVLVGARSNDESGENAGAAYVFTRSNGAWTQQAKLIADDALSGDNFGSTLIVDGDTVMVGAEARDEGGNNAGAVYVFSRTGGDWTQAGKLRASDGRTDAHFGASISLEDSVAVIGAYHANASSAAQGAGALYVFLHEDGVWQEQTKIIASDGVADDYLGFSVASQGYTIFTGASRDDSKGSVYVFEIDAPNQVPVAAAGPDQAVACTSPGQPVSVTLDGSGSSDPDGDALTHTWLENGVVLATGVSPTIALNVGTHNIALVVNDGLVDSLPDEVQIVVNDCQVDCSPPDESVWEHCTPECPCHDGVGDCDVDADCDTGGRCVHDVGPSYGYDDPEMDVCVVGCSDLGVGGRNFCTPECPCAHGEADCNDDEDCEPGLRCLHDVGTFYGYSDSDLDVCVAGCPDFDVGGFDFCTTECPCDHGEGDCDSNAECADGLTCVRNVGPSYGYDDPDIDVCLASAAAMTIANPSLPGVGADEK